MRRAPGSLHHEVWESLGETDPDWAVLTDPARRHGGWEADLDAFYATGRTEIAEVLAALPTDAPRHLAVDWGSGTGRLTFALAEHFEHVLAVDVSRSMLSQLTTRSERMNLADRVTATHLEAAHPSGQADLVVSLLVLQHLPSKDAAEAALAGMLGWLRPGGHLVVELPDRAATRRARLQPRYHAYRVARALGVSPARLHARGLSGISMLTLDSAAVHRTVVGAGGLVVASDVARENGGHVYMRYLIRRVGQDPQSEPTGTENPRPVKSPGRRTRGRRGVLVVGSGLAGATAAHALARSGVAVEVVERQAWWGGQLRTARAGGVAYEPHGAHILHTQDHEVWRMVSALVPIRPYRHRVLTEVQGRLLSWPPQVDELRTMPEWPQIERELGARPTVPDKTNFETWCVDVMGRTLYEWFVHPYTVKQWGADPRTLAAHWAPKRLELRTDGHRDLFRDEHQGWPEGGYTGLIDALLRDVPVVMGQVVDARNWAEVTRDYQAVVLTSALDELFDDALGPLPWRGVHLVHRWVPGVDHVLPAAVVNHPGLDQGYTRRIETKWMSGDRESGTVVSEEYPGASARHYPVDDVEGRNRELATRYVQLVGRELGPHVVLAGRLATYSYIDMDQAMRQGLNAAHTVLRQVRDVA